MSALKNKYKILLFLSSYTPLFLILFLKAISQAIEIYQKIEQINIFEYLASNIILISVISTIILLTIIPNIILVRILNDIMSTTNSKQLRVHSVQKMNHIYMEYLVSYIIPFLSFDFSNIFDVLALMLLLLTICVIYINSDLLYINIIFNIRGYNLYSVTDASNNIIMTLSKKKQLKTGVLLSVRDVSESTENFVLDIEG